MLCSVCNKNTAVVFVNKVEDGKKSVEGYCYNCAKEKGINPLEALAKNANISNSELEDMTTQIESLLKDFSENMNLESLGINPEDLESELDANDPEAGPLSGILGIFRAKDPNATMIRNDCKNKEKYKYIAFDYEAKNECEFVYYL